jgi:hypothetical protein
MAARRPASDRQQPGAKVPRGDAPRIWLGIEAEKRRVLNRNTRSFDNEEPEPKPQATPARLLPRAVETRALHIAAVHAPRRSVEL